MNIKPTVMVLMAISLLHPVITNAEGFRGRIVKTQGDVKVLMANGESMLPEKLNNLVKESETIITSASSKAVIQFSDGSMAVLNESSSLLVEKTEWLSQLGGRIYFAFKKVFGKKPRKIKTSFVTLGIRGTSFIVDSNTGAESVALQEGSLSVESPGDDFELVKETPEDEFAAFKQQQQQQAEKVEQEFSDYKNKINEEFVEYVKEFTLQPDKMVSFNGQRVNETAITDELRQEFDTLEGFAGDIVDEYKN
ncbi:MAG: FecR family protein [Gammaproteobacteria bacterium]|nr:FecR family protein [Gammaproteobacteria bacterium]